MFRKIVLLVQRLFLKNQKLKNEPVKFEPIFIIGAPRSGSTILYQLLISQYKLGYISNLMALLPYFLPNLFNLTLNKIKDYIALPKNDLGYIGGLHAPNEAGAIMKFWFENFDKYESHKIKNLVYSLSNLIQAPIVFKNLNNSLRLDVILEIFPNAKIIVNRRNAFFNAQSIYAVRKKNNETQWWSVAPKEYETQLNKDPLEQISWQIHQIESQIQKHRKHQNFIDVDYEKLMNTPTETLSFLGDILNLKSKEKKPILPNLKASRNIWLSKNEESQLHKALTKYDLKH